MNIALGKVTRTYSRKGTRKLFIQYTGVHGHQVGEEFSGSLPSQESVRIYKILWHRAPPPIDGIEPKNSELEMLHHPMGEINTFWSDEDTDFQPIPTARTLTPEIIPCVTATYRNIVRDYGDSNYDQRNQIWHRILSAMKLSLANVRQMSERQRRRRPLPETNETSSENTNTTDDTRAIKRATKLVLEGCVSKAAKVLDRKFKPNTLTNQETLGKLELLHPQKACTFTVPNDAPIIVGISTNELREAGRRLAKGVSPGPTGTTDGIIRILLDDEVCCLNLCHMIADLINGFVSKEVRTRINRARLVAIPKPDGGVRPVAMGEVLGKLAGITLLQRYEATLGCLFEPMQ